MDRYLFLTETAILFLKEVFEMHNPVTAEDAGSAKSNANGIMQAEKQESRLRA